MILLLAAILALSMHVLPAVAVAVAAAQTSSSNNTGYCMFNQDCVTSASILAGCYVDLVNIETTGLSKSQFVCLCKTPGYISAEEACFACLGYPPAGLEDRCAVALDKQSATFTPSKTTTSTHVAPTFYTANITTGSTAGSRTAPTPTSTFITTTKTGGAVVNNVSGVAGLVLVVALVSQLVWGF